MDDWERAMEWEKTLPNRFHPEKSKPGSDYNLHHNIVEATAEEIGRLVAMREADKMAKKKGLYILHIDGGKKASAAGEMAEGAIGALLKEPSGATIDGAQVSERLSEPIPDPHTAEYKALLAGLEMARDRYKVQYVAVFSDSRTLVNQVNDLWDRKGHLADLRNQAREELEKFRGWQVSWVPRKMNQEADDLVNGAFDSADEVVHSDD